MYAKLAVRDLSILAVTLALWALDARGGGTIVAIAAGIGTGACAFLFHEWGHLLGALATGGVFAPPARLASPFLFSFDARRNDRRRFVLMSLSGFAATGLFLVVFALWLPLDRLAGKVGMGIALTLATLTVLIEFPLLGRVLVGKPIPTAVEVYPTRTPS
jgi:hypothetical protein